MLRYLKAAFWAGPIVPVIGQLPINLLFLAAVGIFGFLFPPLWLAGIGIETAYLFMLATNPRFQKVIDAQAVAARDDDTERHHNALLAQLSPADRQRLDNLTRKCARIIQLGTSLQAEDFSLDANRDALQRLQWLYLKLLTARTCLMNRETSATEVDLARQIKDLTAELASDKLPPALRESKAATRDLLQKRLASLQRRAQTLAEIDSDLVRIEAQIDLALENAPLRNAPHTISANIDLVSSMLDPEVFGAASSAVATLDSTYIPPSSSSVPSAPTAVPAQQVVPPPLPTTPPPLPATPAHDDWPKATN